MPLAWLLISLRKLSPRRGVKIKLYFVLNRYIILVLNLNEGLIMQYIERMTYAVMLATMEESADHDFPPPKFRHIHAKYRKRMLPRGKVFARLAIIQLNWERSDGFFAKEPKHITSKNR